MSRLVASAPIPALVLSNSSRAGLPELSEVWASAMSSPLAKRPSTNEMPGSLSSRPMSCSGWKKSVTNSWMPKDPGGTVTDMLVSTALAALTKSSVAAALAPP